MADPSAEEGVEQQTPRLAFQRRYPVAPGKVWHAWTDPQALSRWFGPGEGGAVTRADMDVRVGGAYLIAFRTPDGESHQVSGAYQEVEAPSRLVFTWAWQSTPERVSRVSLTFRAVPGGTDLHLVHDRFFDQQACDNHERGWLPALAHLDVLFAAPV